MACDFPVYQKISGIGAEFMCHVLENGKSRLVFSGATAADAKSSAEEWANRALDTPGRAARIADATAARNAARAKKKGAA